MPLRAPPLPPIPRTAIVTGAESGIGRACAIALGSIGHRVAITYFRDRNAADESCQLVEQAGGQAIPIRCDVSDEGAVEQAFDLANDRFGSPTILVNSAGLNQAHVPVAEMTSGQWHRLFATDLDGVFFAMRRFLHDCIDRDLGGSIVNIGSIHGQAMRAGAADYCAAKAGLEALTRTVALEVADRGITANVIAPGMILTPMNQHAVEDARYRRKLERNIPARRAGTPEEVAEMVLYLTSPAARYVTGTVLTIDGALSLLLGQGA
jgi:glucose 1-dehydrogenase